MNVFMRKLVLLLMASALNSSLKAQKIDAEIQSADTAAIKNVVERFLVAAGNYDIGAVPPMFTSKANISGASLKNGKWTSYTMSINEFIEALKARPNPVKYTEPVHKWTIFIEGGQLAFVRADATLNRDGKPSSHNIDYFTLVKENGDWKILNGSYVSVPIKEKLQ